MDWLTGGVVALCGLGLTALWRIARSSSMLGDIKQAALRNHDNLAHLQADIDSMSSRQDKNFNELGTAWIEMKCKLQSLEEKVHGKSTVWKTKLGE